MLMPQKEILGFKAFAKKCGSAQGLVWKASFAGNHNTLFGLGINPDIAFAKLERAYLEEESKHIIYPEQKEG